MFCLTDISKDQREVVKCEHPAPPAECFLLDVGSREKEGMIWGKNRAQIHKEKASSESEMATALKLALSYTCINL